MAKARPHPDFAFEAAARARGLEPICGIDEAGRGPWAGPVVAAAVILTPGQIPMGLADSKVLSRQRRDALYAQIMSNALVDHAGHATGRSKVGLGAAPCLGGW